LDTQAGAFQGISLLNPAEAGFDQLSGFSFLIAEIFRNQLFGPEVRFSLSLMSSKASVSVHDGFPDSLGFWQ